MEMPEGFALSTILEREDPRDAFISNNYASLKEMPAGAIVGTSSLRREAQIRRKYPHLKIVPLRGNLDTRLGKLDSGEFDAMILACAGLLRLNLESRIRERIDPVDSLPAASQGALGIEILETNHAVDAYLTPLKDHLATLQVSAERQVSRRLGGSCEIPIAAYAEWTGDGVQLHLKALVASINGQEIVEATKTSSVATMEEAIQLGDQVADDLINKGAMELIAALGS
jgi:hydroxymethylbilane synthase